MFPWMITKRQNVLLHLYIYIHKHQNRRRSLTGLLRKLGIVTKFDAGVDLQRSPLPTLKGPWCETQRTSQPRLYRPPTVFTFSVYKNIKKKTVLSDNPSNINGPKRDKVATEGRGFQEYRLQYQNVVRVDAREACKCSCHPVHP